MSNAMIGMLLEGCWQTLEMVFLSCFFATVFGLPLGVFLFITQRNQVLSLPALNKTLGVMANILRSIPFIILMVAIIPFTRLLVGTSIGTTAAIVPLTIAAIPFVARLIESALTEVPAGLIETALSMGATPMQVVMKVLLPESMPGVIRGITLTMVTLVGYSAMAGAVGGGGLGDIAIQYGYNRFNMPVMVTTILILVVMVQLLQWVGDTVAKRMSHVR